MSDTRRHCDPPNIWGIGVPSFDHWNATEKNPVMSRKHQERDRPSAVLDWKFRNGMKNSLYNLERKIDQLREKEALDGRNN